MGCPGSWIQARASTAHRPEGMGRQGCPSSTPPPSSFFRALSLGPPRSLSAGAKAHKHFSTTMTPCWKSCFEAAAQEVEPMDKDECVETKCYPSAMQADLKVRNMTPSPCLLTRLLPPPTPPLMPYPCPPFPPSPLPLSPSLPSPCTLPSSPALPQVAKDHGMDLLLDQNVPALMRAVYGEALTG